MRWKLYLSAAIALHGGAARADDDHAARRGLARIEHAEPTAAATVRAALRHAGLAHRPEVSMRRRARLAAALPTLSLKAARQTDWDEASGDRADVVGDVGQEVVLEARATWRLDRLVFDGAELRTVALGQQRARARAALASETTSLYYKRRALQVDQLWHPPETIEEQIKDELALEELTAQLDALTGGWWSDQRGSEAAP
jgi:hypothetical protein